MSSENKRVLNGQVGEYKAVAINEIIFTDRDGLSEEIISAINPKYLDEPTELIYKHIFPYMRIPDTIDTVDSYILVGVDVPKVSTVNYFFKQIVLSLMVVVHQDAMFMDGKTNRNRCDYIAERLNSIFNKNTIFTGDKLEYVSDVEGIVMNKFHTRTMRFTVEEVNNPRCETIS